MSKLMYSSFEELKKVAVIDEKTRDQLTSNGMTCDKLYEKYNKVLKTALNTPDLENQYILLMRCGEIGEILMQKNNFKNFGEKEKLKNTFKNILLKLVAIENELKSAYEIKASLTKAVETVKPTAAITVTETSTVMKRSMQPKELIRLVEREKKSVLILDFRKDQEKAFIKYSKGHVHPIVVVSIPRELIDHGLVFNTLKLQIPVAHRAQINKISTFDLVVMMDDEDIPLENDKPLQSSPAYILNNALTEYNLRDKLKNSTVFMEGGFSNWKLQYSVYVEEDKSAKKPKYEDQLEDWINKYKDATFSLPDFPSLSPTRKVQEKVTFPEMAQEEEAKVPIAKRLLKPSESASNITNENIKIVDQPIPTIASEPKMTIPDRETKYIPQTEIKPKDNPLNISPSRRLAGGFSNISNGQIKSNEPSIPNRPAIDRGNKPKDIVSSIKEVKPASSLIQPSKQAIIPSLDRTTKPSLISPIDQSQQAFLLSIYQSMTENLSSPSNAVRRSDRRPGQTGLYNMGNTCFMNACLQALFQTPMLSETFTKNRFTSKVNTLNRLGTQGIISAVFSALMDNVWSGEFGALRPQRFLGVFKREVNSDLMNGEQQDASEFYVMLMDSLHEDTNQVVKGTPPVQNYEGGLNIRNDADDFNRKQSQFSYSPISRILHSRTVSELTCTACNTQSITFEEINIIQVELPPESYESAKLNQCLHKSFSLTNLDGKWDCPCCKTARSATQKRSLWSLSPVIVIHLLRFSYNGSDYSKNNIRVIFDADNFDMNPFLHPSSPDKTKDSFYKLYSVTNHRGRLNSGHYTAHARHLQSGEWLRCDDETVTPMKLGEINVSLQKSDAYILYFKRK